MTVIDQRDLVIPHYHVALVRKRLDAEQAVADQITALTAEPGWSSSRWHEYEELCGKQAAEARSLACLVRALLEVDHDETAGRPA